MNCINCYVDLTGACSGQSQARSRWSICNQLPVLEYVVTSFMLESCSCMCVS